MVNLSTVAGHIAQFMRLEVAFRNSRGCPDLLLKLVQQALLVCAGCGALLLLFNPRKFMPIGSPKRR